MSKSFTEFPFVVQDKVETPPIKRTGVHSINDFGVATEVKGTDRILIHGSHGGQSANKSVFLNDVFPYFAFEVIADNITDNYAVIQALIDKAEAGDIPADIVLPSGKIVISDTLIIQGVTTLGFSGASSGIRLRGHGMLNTQIRCTQTDKAAVQIGTDSSVNGIGLEDFGLIGAGKTNAGTIGIDAGSVTGVGAGTWSIGGSFYWANVWVEAFETGLRFLDNTLCTFDNLHVKDCDIGAKLGFQVDILTFTGCRFDDCLEKCIDFTYRDGSGEHDSGSLQQNNINFIGCRFNANDGSNGAVVFDMGIKGISNVLILGAYYEDCDKIATIGESGSGGGCKSIVFDNNFFTVVNDINTQITVADTSNDDSVISVRNCRSDAAAADVSGGWILAGSQTALIYENNTLPSDGFQVRRTDAAGSIDYTLDEEDTFKTLSKIKIIGNGAELGASEYFIDIKQVNGADKNYLQFARLNAATGAILNSDFTIRDIGGLGPQAEGIIKLNQNASKPTASATYQGTMWIIKGGGGARDTIEICLKSDAGSYSWVTMADGGA